jgi:tetratricopeptide (TPR) repeat protein
MGQQSLSEREAQILRTAQLMRFRQSGIVLAMLVATLFADPQFCFAQASTTLTNLEQKLFFKNYSDESDEARLARLEKQLFGESMSGAFQDRLNRVVGAASPQVNPDGSISGMNAQKFSGTTSSVAAPSAEDLKSRAEEERQAAMERAKVAVMAAREEQTNKLIETGVSLWRAKRGTEALQYFEQALKLDPHNANALYYAGIVYESKKSYAEALAAYRKASNEDPGNREYSDAVLAVQKLMNSRPAVDPRQAEISKLASEAGDAYKRGEYLSALDLYKQLDQKAPNQPLVKYNLGTLYLHAGQFQRALEYFEIAVKLRPTDQKFQQAYQQLKANVDKADAAERLAEANFNGNRQSAGGAGVGQTKPYGHEAMNIAARGGTAQPGNVSAGGQFTAGGAQSNQQASQQSPAGGSDFINGNGATNQQPVTSKSVAIPPGAGHEPGYAPMTDTNGSLKQWAQAPKAKQQSAPLVPKPASKAPQSRTGQALIAQATSAQSSPPTLGASLAAASSQSQNQSAFQPESQSQFQPLEQAPFQSQIPPGQHPLIPHPLKGAKPLASSSSANGFTPAPSGSSLSNLRQPVSNPLTDLGILASNGRNGVTIAHIGIASRASRAGLLQGDIIRAVDNKVVSTIAQVTALVSKKGPSESITLHVQRKDQMGVVHL